MKEIGCDATKRSDKMSIEDEGFLKTIQMGGGMAMQDLAKLDVDVDDGCAYCGSPNGSLDHILWTCHVFQPVREDTDKQLAMVRTKSLLPCVRRGIAPMMTCSPMETYWGWKLLDPTPEEAKLLGAEMDYQAHGIDHEEVEKVLTNISKDGTLNARQAMEAAKGAFSEGVSPIFPPDVTVAAILLEMRQNDDVKDEPRGGSRWAQLVFRDTPEPKDKPLRCLKMPRDTISTYTDGGVKNPANKWLATAGFGIWTPDAETDEEASKDELELT